MYEWRGYESIQLNRFEPRLQSVGGFLPNHLGDFLQDVLPPRTRSSIKRRFTLPVPDLVCTRGRRQKIGSIAPTLARKLPA